MNIEYLTQLLDNKLKALANAKDQAFTIGDLLSVNNIDQEILGVENTLYSLKLMQQVNIIASSTNVTPTELIQNGINVTQSTPVLLANATMPMSVYDINSYATDPLHEQKIADILSYMGEMNSPADVDIYIDNEAIGSPVTGQMVFNSALKYNVDIRLMLALMELDSRFGTAGVAIRTLNPGNVGNDDSGQTHTYSSWEEGVDAVANWLNNHRIDNIDLVTPVIEQNIETKTEEVIAPVIQEPNLVVPIPEASIENPVVAPEVPVVESAIDKVNEVPSSTVSNVSRTKSSRKIV